MRGFPKHFNTAADVAICRGLFPDETAGKLREMISAKDIWVPVQQIPEKDVSKITEDETHRVRAAVEDRTTVYYLDELREDRTSKLFTLGLDVESVKAEISEIAEEVEKEPAGADAGATMEGM